MIMNWEMFFVFATCNSDPIYLGRGVIYTCCHGTDKIKHEKIAEDFDEFIESIAK